MSSAEEENHAPFSAFILFRPRVVGSGLVRIKRASNGAMRAMAGLQQLSGRAGEFMGEGQRPEGVLRRPLRLQTGDLRGDPASENNDDVPGSALQGRPVLATQLAPQ